MFSFTDITNAATVTMQATRELSKQRRNTKRRHSRKKSLSPSDLKGRGEGKSDTKFNTKRSLSEVSMKVKHRKSNIRRTLTHPITGSDGDFSTIELINRVTCEKVEAKPPESDESNLPPTSSDRDTEDDGRVRPPLQRSRWDSGSELDSLVSITVRRVSARRRRTPSHPG